MYGQTAFMNRRTSVTPHTTVSLNHISGRRRFWEGDNLIVPPCTLLHIQLLCCFSVLVCPIALTRAVRLPQSRW